MVDGAKTGKSRLEETIAAMAKAPEYPITPALREEIADALKASLLKRLEQEASHRRWSPSLLQDIQSWIGGAGKLLYTDFEQERLLGGPGGLLVTRFISPEEDSNPTLARVVIKSDAFKSLWQDFRDEGGKGTHGTFGLRFNTKDQGFEGMPAAYARTVEDLLGGINAVLVKDGIPPIDANQYTAPQRAK